MELTDIFINLLLNQNHKMELDKLARVVGPKAFIYTVITITVIIAVGYSMGGSIFQEKEPIISNTNNYYPTVVVTQQNRNANNSTPTGYKSAVMKDLNRDGYTNIRNGQSINAEIITSVVVGEIFYFKRTSTNWWSVITENNEKGYMYFDRIKPM